MPDIQLYNLVIPSSSKTGKGSSVSRNVQSGGVPGEDVAAVTSVAIQPEEQTIQGQFRANYADEMAAEIRELWNAAGYEAVPYAHADGSNDPATGYYSLQEVNVEPVEARGEGLFQIDGTLVRQGTTSSHYRAVRTNPQTVTNDFGSRSGEQITIPAFATDVQWIDERGGQRKEAGRVGTSPGAYCNHAHYDSQYVGWKKPTLVYRVPYHREREGDCRIWDDHNRQKREYVYPPDSGGATVGSATVGSATVGAGRQVRVQTTWQRVFRTDHDYEGDMILETGRLRLIPDEQNGHITAQRWNAATNNWDLIQLGVSPWRLSGWNMTRIAPERIEAQADFRNTDTGDRYTLDATVRRGMALVNWKRPKNASQSTPSGLVDRLAPIARPSERDSNETQGLIKRTRIPS